MEYYITGHTERCISCDIDTKIPKALDISRRTWYIEGAGQLCKACYQRLHPHEELSMAEDAWSL